MSLLVGLRVSRRSPPMTGAAVRSRSCADSPAAWSVVDVRVYPTSCPLRRLVSALYLGHCRTIRPVRQRLFYSDAISWICCHRGMSSVGLPY
jgi:hypothetical protein